VVKAEADALSHFESVHPQWVVDKAHAPIEAPDSDDHNDFRIVSASLDAAFKLKSLMTVTSS
jgi:hypothetical protein